MTGPVAVFWTDSPAVRAAWTAAVGAVAQYQDDVAARLAAAGVGAVPRLVTRGMRPGRLVGLRTSAAPGGWRMARRAELAVPDPATAAGREVRLAIDTVRYPGDPAWALRGMPNWVAGPGLVRYSCEVAEGDGRLWVAWPCPVSGDLVDWAVWHAGSAAGWAAAR